MTVTSQTESEAAFVIVSETPGGLADEIAGRVSIAAFALHFMVPQKIRDFYFDTPDRSLAARALALRLRTVGTVPLITFKGPSRQTEWGMERLELEEAWSTLALARVMELLGRNGVKLRLPVAKEGTPLQMVINLGLNVIQDRETYRQSRRVADKDADGITLGELAVDAVVYHFGSRDIRLHEIELEMKMPQGSSAAKAIAESLVAQYKPALRRWPYPKLLTGEAISRLLKQGALDSLVAADGTLMPSALVAIERYIECTDL